MAMIKCKECGAEISTKAEAYPMCGKSNPTNKTSLLYREMDLLYVAFQGGCFGKM